MESESNAGAPASTPVAQELHSLSQSSRATWASWLSPRQFQLSLTLLGLCVFTFSIVTFRLPLGIAGIAIAVLGMVLHIRKLRVPRPVWLYSAFVLWATVSSLVSRFADAESSYVVGSFKLLLIMLVIVNALRTRGQLRFYLLFFLVCFVLFPVRGTLLGGDTIAGRAVWNYIYSNPNDLAALCLIALGVALGFLSSRRAPMLVRVSAGAGAILLLVTILLTQSRGAFIGLVAGFVPALLWWGLRRPGLLLAFAGTVALVIYLAIPAAVWERLSGIEKLTSISTVAEADPEGSAEQRLEIQRVALKIVLDHPVFGVGPGAYSEANAAYAPYLGKRDTHNTYLNLAAEVGLVGLVLWCILVVSVLSVCFRRRRLAPPDDLATRQAWLERAFWGFLVAGLFGSYAALTFPYIALAVLWCSATHLVPASKDSKAIASTTDE